MGDGGKGDGIKNEYLACPRMIVMVSWEPKIDFVDSLTLICHWTGDYIIVFIDNMAQKIRLKITE